MRAQSFAAFVVPAGLYLSTWSPDDPEDAASRTIAVVTLLLGLGVVVAMPAAGLTPVPVSAALSDAIGRDATPRRFGTVSAVVRAGGFDFSAGLRRPRQVGRTVGGVTWVRSGVVHYSGEQCAALVIDGSDAVLIARVAEQRPLARLFERDARVVRRAAETRAVLGLPDDEQVER